MTKWVRPCEQVLTAEKAEGIRVLLEELTGMLAPCERGLDCPMFPSLKMEPGPLRQQDRQHVA